MSTIDQHLNSRFGFTCQTWLATDIANRHFGGKYRAWFATSLNPPQNGSSSNPLALYQELDRIVYTNDLLHGRIEQLRRRLSDWITASVFLPSHSIVRLKREIEVAPVRSFRPSIWRIDLAKINIYRMTKLGQFPDEYQIRNLVNQEFEDVTR